MARDRVVGHVRLRSAPVGLVAFSLFAAVAAPSSLAATDPIKTSISADLSGGYARLVFTMAEYDEATARLTNNVLVISFQNPITTSVDRLAVQLPGYVGAVRLDPDGKAIRFALSQPVTLHATSADEKYFIDLLPQSWSGPPPGLPAQVIADLARRAREADLLQRRDHAQQRSSEPIRVRVAVQPTFTRYVFEIPPETSVSSETVKGGLNLTFAAPYKFDLGEAEAALPPGVASIAADLHDRTALVRFTFVTQFDVRTFRDSKGYVVDLVGADAKPAHPAAASSDAAAIQAAAAVLNASAASGGPSPQDNGTAAKPAAPLPASGTPQAAAAQQPVSASPADSPSAPAAGAERPALQASPPARPASQPANPSPASALPSAASPQAGTGAAAPSIAAAPVQTAGPKPGSDKVAVELAREGANLRMAFSFAAPTAAAIFQRAETLWIVFDTRAAIDLSALAGEATHTIRTVDLTRSADAVFIRIMLDHPHLATVDTDGSRWTVQIGDTAMDRTHALDLSRNLIGPNRSTVTIAMAEPHLVHHVADPEAGDKLIVVTAFAPARGIITPKSFVEFRALASTQGVVVEPLADDVSVELAPDRVVISRPAGLTLSSSAMQQGSGLRPVMFDSQTWGADRKAAYWQRQSSLIAAAAAAPEGKRLAPRVKLARFYLAQGMYVEAKGVLDVALADARPSAENVSLLVLRAMAEIMINRPDDALKDLADPAVGNLNDAPLWRALAYARQGKWAQARDGFKTEESAVATLPIELQRVALKEELRSDIEVGDLSGASNHLNEFAIIGVPHELEPAVAVLMGRLAEGMGRTEEALAEYRAAANSWDRRAAAQGELRETLLRYSLGEVKRDDAIAELETLTTIWRGDDTEVEALQMLARLYTLAGRYRDAFYVMRSAVAAHPNSDMTRRIQQEAAATFDALFLAGKGDSLAAIDALALFYDFRELTPIGSRGDEMIRRLADRLVSVDLLDQAAQLLQYQVDKRLQGAARAQVGARLAIVYLMDRKPDRALATLRTTRTADLSENLRNQRLLLEGRALSDLKRYDLALEVIANVDGREAIRLRSDIYWAARRWGKAAEQIELLYGERWKEWQPLSETERADILRAEIGYSLAEDKLGLDRFREKYAAKMAETPDAHAFEIVSAPLGANGAEFATIAHQAAADDTLGNFLREMNARYAEPAGSHDAAGDPSAPPAAGIAPLVAPAAPSRATPSPSAVPGLGSPPLRPSAAAGRTAER